MFMASLENLNLSDDEEETLDFQEQDTEEKRADPNPCLVGRFLTTKPIQPHIMKERMATVWQPGRRVSIKEIEKGIFLFQFFHKLDVQRVMNGSPWSFDGYILILSLVGAT